MPAALDVSRTMAAFAAATLLSAFPGLARAQMAPDAATPSPSMPSTQAAAQPPMAEWTPLDVSQFGRELTQRWIPVPNGSSGAPRQGWLNTADGFFTREGHLAFADTDRSGGEDQVFLARFNYPLSRRVWVGLELPFYARTRTDGLRSRDGVADGTLTTQVMLFEDRDTSVNVGVGWNLPWGDRDVGGDGGFGAQPQINLFRDVGHGVAVRGRIGYQIREGSAPDAFVFNAALGQTVTPHARTPFGDFTYYLSANWTEPTRGASFFSLTPGMRTHLGGNLFFLAGVEVPVANRNQTFGRRVFAQFVQGF